MINWKPIKPPFARFKKKVFIRAAQVSGIVYQIGEYPALRQLSGKTPISRIKSEDVKAKIAYLKECLLRYRKITGYGRGIAGVQVGIRQRIAVVYSPHKLITIINPKITKKSEKLLLYPEVCMSANPVIAPTIRPSWIEFEYYDENGRKQYWDKKDDTNKGKMMNRIFQHEIDHMDGIINIDKVKSPRDLILESDPAFYKKAKFEEVEDRGKGEVSS